MTETDDTEPTPAAEPAPPAARITDAILLLLVNTANAEGHEDYQASVTLNTDGGTVTGELVGRERWFKDVGRHMQEADPEGHLTKTIREFWEVLEEDGKPEVFSIVTLINAEVPGPSGNYVGVPYRVPIDRVSGWTMGYTRAQ